MRITSISVYRVEIPFGPLGSLWIGRRAPDHLDSSIVAIETDVGFSGYGESCPIGAIYLPAFAKGLRAAIDAMAPALIGADPTRIDGIGKTMNEALFGHSYAKAALDIACWDLLGKSTGLAVSELMGGRHQASVAAYASIPTDTPNAMVETFRAKRSEGFRRFQIKVGDDPLDDVARVRAIVAAGDADARFMVDANRGWSKADALRAVGQLQDVDCFVEQPCATYEECLTVRARCNRPMILDEVIDGPEDLARAIGDDALDGLVIKITHAGGLTPARLMRDICVRHGILMRIEDTAGTEIARAAQAQLAAATPASMQLGSYTFQNDMPPVADGAPEIRDGCLYLNEEPGLGIEPRMEMLGEPVAVYG